MKNFGLKLWSLLIAVSLAYFVHSGGNASTLTLVVPIQHNLSKEKVILLPAETQVSVTVRGPAYLVSKLAASPPVLQVNFPPDVEDRYRVSFQASELGLPRGVELLSFEPPEIEYVIDNYIERSIPVVVPRIGNVSPQVKLKSLTIDPPSIVVGGPETEVKGIKTVETTPLDLRGVAESVSSELKLRAPGKFVKLPTETVTVDVRVVSVQLERRFEDVKLEIRSREDGKFLAEPSTIDVEVIGPRSSIRSLRKDAVVPYVIARNVPAEGIEVAVSLDLGAEIGTLLIDPPAVKLKKIPVE